MRKGTFKAALVLSAGLWIFCAPSARGNAEVYWDFDSGFNPSQVVISPGESVTWWNYDMYGFSVTITVGGSLTFTLRDFYGGQVTFPYPGIYSMSSDYGDSGSVIVGTAPSVTITNPVDGAVFTAPATITVNATATGLDGISSVQFYVDSISGSDMIGEDFDSPYSATTTLSEGSYTLTAVATDDYGLQDSDSINITVNPRPSAALGNPRLLDGLFLFDVTGLTAGKTNVVQYCTDLSNGLWVSASTNTAASDSATITNAVVAGLRFYRVFELP
jgi:hypothetical protein